MNVLCPTVTTIGKTPAPAYGDLLAQLTAAKTGLYKDTQENQVDLLRRMRDRRVCW